MMEEWNDNASSSWNDMNSAMQVASEMLCVMEVATKNQQWGRFIHDVSTMWHEIYEESLWWEYQLERNLP